MCVFKSQDFDEYFAFEQAQFEGVFALASHFGSEKRCETGTLAFRGRFGVLVRYW